MSKKLYWTIEKRSFRFAYFVFFDVHPYLADHLFIKRKVRVWFGDEYKCEDHPYAAIFCHVRKRDVPAFLDALEELKNSMLICGYRDYEEVVGGIVEKINQEKEASDNGRHDSHKKAEQEKPTRLSCLKKRSLDDQSDYQTGRKQQSV